MIALAFAALIAAHAAPAVKPVATAPSRPAAVQDVPVAPLPTSVAVTLECTAHANGRVDGCKVLGETHPGLGFGEAAIALMQGSEVERGVGDVQFARTIQFTP